MNMTSFEILFSVSTWIFQIAFLENGDAKTPLIICSHFDQQIKWTSTLFSERWVISADSFCARLETFKVFKWHAWNKDTLKLCAVPSGLALVEAKEEVT